jgi:flagellar biosynthesis/type III secretory pathway M-ring protein FliF/YscJ
MNDVLIQGVGNLFQILAYIVGPIVLGVMIFYGIRQTRRRQAAARKPQDDAVQNVYSADEADRSAKERAAEGSSNPIDVAQRKSGTTG